MTLTEYYTNANIIYLSSQSINNMNMFKNLFSKHGFGKLTTGKISSEALDAYFSKLPDKISVRWGRDGEYIVGKINADGQEFMTQAKSAKEFVYMVNDGLFAMYEIPEEYLDILQSQKSFKPNAKQFEELNDVAIKESIMSFKKELAVA